MLVSADTKCTQNIIGHIMVEVEDDSPLGVLNRIRNGFRAKSRRLARLIPRQTIEFLADNEESFRELQEDIRNFHYNLGLWEDTLPHVNDPVDGDEVDEGLDRGNPVYPEAGPGAGYIPERVKVILGNFREEINKLKIDFVKFKKEQGFNEQLAIAR